MMYNIYIKCILISNVNFNSAKPQLSLHQHNEKANNAFNFQDLLNTKQKILLNPKDSA